MRKKKHCQRKYSLTSLIKRSLNRTFHKANITNNTHYVYILFFSNISLINVLPFHIWIFSEQSLIRS